MNVRKKVSLYVLLWVVALSLFVSGCIDLDWQIVSYKFDMYNGSNGFWEFCPYIILPWYIAYIITFVRVVVGAGMIGALLLYTCLVLVGATITHKPIAQ